MVSMSTPVFLQWPASCGVPEAPDLLPGEVGLGGPHHCGDQAMAELSEPGHGEVEEKPAGALPL